MSGTPIINYPNEMGVLFNMLRGHIKTWKITIPTTGKKLTQESIVKMFRDADFRTYDYVDYSNDTLTITRNPFGFINTKKPGVPTGTKRSDVPKFDVPKFDVPKTIVRRGGTILNGGDADSSDSDSETEQEIDIQGTFC